jgi:hypothetical protein
MERSIASSSDSRFMVGRYVLREAWTLAAVRRGCATPRVDRTWSSVGDRSLPSAAGRGAPDGRRR